MRSNKRILPVIPKLVRHLTIKNVRYVLICNLSNRTNKIYSKSIFNCQINKNKIQYLNHQCKNIFRKYHLFNKILYVMLLSLKMFKLLIYSRFYKMNRQTIILNNKLWILNKILSRDLDLWCKYFDMKFLLIEIFKIYLNKKFME